MKKVKKRNNLPSHKYIDPASSFTLILPDLIYFALILWYNERITNRIKTEEMKKTVNFFNEFEIRLLHGLNSAVSCDFLDTVMPYITSLANSGIFWIVIALVLLFFKRTRKVGVTMGIALCFGLIFGNIILKPLVARIRPYDFDPSIVLLIPPEKDFSFPSGHTLASFEGAVSIFLYNKKVGCAAIALAALIAFSRLYLMVHYPIDVIAGAILGTLFAVIAMRLTKLIPWKSSSGITK